MEMEVLSPEELKRQRIETLDHKISVIKSCLEKLRYAVVSLSEYNDPASNTFETMINMQRESLNVIFMGYTSIREDLEPPPDSVPPLRRA